MEVSVVIPVYNRAQKIGACIDSVLAQQTAVSFEIIAVDDGSTDSTPEQLAAYGDRIRILRIENSGPSVARDTGIQAANAELICLLDSDDIMLPGRIELQARHMLNHPSIDLTFGAVLRPSHGETPYLPGLPLDTDWRELNEPYRRLMTSDSECILTVTVMLRKSAYFKAGGFNPALRCGEDMDLWLKLARFARFAFTGVPLARVGEDDSDARLTRSRWVYLHGPTVLLNELAGDPPLDADDFSSARRTCRRSVNMMLRYDWLHCGGRQLARHKASIIKVLGLPYYRAWRVVNLVPAPIGRMLRRIARTARGVPAA